MKLLAAGLLEKSELVGKKRFAFQDGRPYCAQQHGDDLWHGYPVSWKEVPAELRNKWKRAKLITKREIDRYWECDT